MIKAGCVITHSTWYEKYNCDSTQIAVALEDANAFGGFMAIILRFELGNVKGIDFQPINENATPNKVPWTIIGNIPMKPGEVPR